MLGVEAAPLILADGVEKDFALVVAPLGDDSVHAAARGAAAAAAGQRRDGAYRPVRGHDSSRRLLRGADAGPRRGLHRRQVVLLPRASEALPRAAGAVRSLRRARASAAHRRGPFTSSASTPTSTAIFILWVTPRSKTTKSRYPISSRPSKRRIFCCSSKPCLTASASKPKRARPCAST